MANSSATAAPRPAPASSGPGWRFNTVGRISLGLICLAVALLALLALVLGVPDGLRGGHGDVAARRAAVASALLPLIERDDRAALEQTLERLLRDDPGTGAIAVRRADGVLLAFVRSADPHGKPIAGLDTPWEPVALHSARGRWGAVEFQSRRRDGLPWQMRLALIVGGAAFAVFLGYYIYLRRTLAHLDPSAVIPERVRQAFDVLTQGVLFLDTQGRIVLANAAFRDVHARGEESLTGRNAAVFDWLVRGRGGAPIWARTIASGEPVRNEMRDVPRPDRGVGKVIVHAAPVRDGAGRVRGCILTFDDVTALDRANAELRGALDALEASRAQIAEQNERLQELASRDALTGCFNRRAFFETLAPAVAQAERDQAQVACIMFDIDHFKSINDRYGHAVGDEVIRSVAALAAERARAADYLCRWGGEEFVLLLPRAGLDEAARVAEAVRASIETQAGGRVTGASDVRVTSSFGVSTMIAGAATIDALIDEADQALYRAKRGGRNRVERHDRHAHAA